MDWTASREASLSVESLVAGHRRRVDAAPAGRPTIVVAVPSRPSAPRQARGLPELALPARDRTVGDVLTTLGSPLLRRELLASRLSDEFWRGFWWAAWAGVAVGAWAGWLLGQGTSG